MAVGGRLGRCLPRPRRRRPMSILVNLAPEVEEKLRQKAGQHAQTLEQYVQGLAEYDACVEPAPTVGRQDPNSLSYEEWLARFHGWLASHPHRDTIADDSRESIY